MKRRIILLLGLLALLCGCGKKTESPVQYGTVFGGAENEVVPYEGTYESARLTREEGQEMLQEQLDRLYPDRFLVVSCQDQLNCDGRIYYTYALENEDGEQMAAVDEISAAQFRYDTDYQVVDKWSSFDFYDVEQDHHSWEGTYQSADGRTAIIYRTTGENFEIEFVGGAYDFGYLFGSFGQSIYGEFKCTLSPDEQTLTVQGAYQGAFVKISDSTEYTAVN